MTQTTMVAQKIASDFGFLEGPRWRDGAIWTSDFHRHQVFRIDPGSGAVESICEVPNQPSGLAFAADGSMYVVSMLDRRILRLGAVELETVADLSALTPHPINDLTIDSRGRLYAGAFGCTPWEDPTLEPAPITRIDPDGNVTVVSTDLTFPNGMAFSDDESKLYAADTYACRLVVFDVDQRGDLTLATTIRFRGRVHGSTSEAYASGDFLPDGIAAAPNGRIWVADANGSGVAIVDPAAGSVDYVAVGGLGPALHVYAVAVSPAGEVYGCVAPPIRTWEPGKVFPGHLVRLR